MLFQRIKGLVSIIIPCYNASPYLLDCLNSIVSQSYRDLEIVIVNDGSTDNTKSVIQTWLNTTEVKERFATKHRIQILNLPYNTGYAGANSIGLFLARGEYIAIQDADDLSHPDRICKQMEFLRQHPQVNLVGTSIAEFRSGNPKTKFQVKWIKYGFDQIRQSYENGSSGACYGTLLFQGEVFDRVGGLFRSLRGKRKVTGHDYFFYFSLLERGL